MTDEYSIEEILPDDYKPFKSILKNSREIIFFEYMSFEDYLIFLKKIGKRLKDDYERFSENGEFDPMLNGDLIKRYFDIMDDIQLDQESFVVFSKIFLDKLGMLVEKLTGKRSYNNYLRSFTAHKKFFIDNNSFSPKYSELLKGLYWYDQFLCVVRDKIVTHGGNGICPIFSIKRNRRIIYRRKRGEGLGFLHEKEKYKINNLIIKYGNINENIKNIPLNPATMLDEFIELILENNVKLEKGDLDTLGNIVKNVGGTIDAIILAKHIRKLLDDVELIFTENCTQPTKDVCSQK